MVINFFQKLLKKQFPQMRGLQSTLLQSKKPVKILMIFVLHRYKVQMIHCRCNHWIVASTVHSGSNQKVQVYDSIFDTLDTNTKDVVLNLF